MRVIRTFRRDLETMKRLDGKARRQMIWDYYRLPLIALVSILLLGGLTLAIRIGAANTALYAVFVNAEEGGEKADLDALLGRAGIPMENRSIDVAANYTLLFDDPTGSYAETMQVLAALFGIGDLDVFAADEAVFRAYADRDAFVDLSLFIEQEDLARLRLFTRIGEGGRKLVDGLVLTDPSPLHDAGYYRGEVIVGAAANARNLDEAVAFLRQLALEYRGPD